MPFNRQYGDLFVLEIFTEALHEASTANSQVLFSIFHIDLVPIQPLHVLGAIECKVCSPRILRVSGALWDKGNKRVGWGRLGLTLFVEKG